MYIFFASNNSVSSQILEGEKFRQGDVNANTIYASSVNYTNFSYMAWLKFELPDEETQTPEIPMTATSFTYLGVVYNGFKFTIEDPIILSQHGELKATVRYKNGAGVIAASGTVVIPVEQTVYEPSPSITLTQYNVLLSLFDKYLQKVSRYYPHVISVLPEDLVSYLIGGTLLESVPEDLTDYEIGAILFVAGAGDELDKVYEIYDNDGVKDIREVYDLNEYLSGTFLFVKPSASTAYDIYEVYDNSGTLDTRLIKSNQEIDLDEKIDTEIDKIIDGTYIVKTAEQDKNGNDIFDTYETKSDATTHKARTTILETFKNTTVPATYATKSELSAEVSRAEGVEGALDTAKADKATTLSGYGITNAYTKTEADNLLDEKADLVGGKVPSSQLPAYVDDIIELINNTIYDSTNPIPNGTGGSALPRRALYENFSNVIEIWIKPIPDTAFVYERNAITDALYTTIDTLKVYRLTGTVAGSLVEISASLALGETSSTAYRGDRGKTAYDHSQVVSGNPHNTTKTDIGLGNVDNTSDANKPVSTAQQTELNKKANIDGSYELMTVGVAKQLEASLGVTTNDTFIERTTAGSASVSDGVAEIKSIKGMTILGLVANGDLLTPKASPNENQPLGFDYKSSTDISLTNGIAKFTAIAQYGRIQQSIIYPDNSTIYYYARVKTTSLKVAVGNNYTIGSYHSGNNDYQLLSLVYKNNPATQPVKVVSVRYDTSSDFVPIEVDYIGAINLTKHGLESLTASQVYNLITSNGAYPENMRMLANGGTLENLGITGIKTVGFNQFNGTYARVLAGNEYNVSGTFTTLGFTTTIGGDTSEVVLDEDDHFTPTESGYVYVSGSSTDTVINLSWSGYRDSDYEDYWTETRPIDSATYFPTGMKRVKSTYDELLANKAIQRIGSRAYQVGDLTNADVITNGTTTYYILETPVETAISPILNLSYRISDFGTEEWLQAEGNFIAPIYSTIFYQENLRDKLQRLADIQTPSVETDGTFIPQVVVATGIPTISWQPKDEPELPTLPTTPSTTFVLKCIVDESGVPTLSWVAESV